MQNPIQQVRIIIRNISRSNNLEEVNSQLSELTDAVNALTEAVDSLTGNVGDNTAELEQALADAKQALEDANLADAVEDEAFQETINNLQTQLDSAFNDASQAVDGIKENIDKIKSVTAQANEDPETPVEVPDDGTPAEGTEGGTEGEQGDQQ